MANDKQSLVMKRAFKYRLYPTKEQEEILDKYLEESRQLYNSLLEASIKAYKEENKNLLGYDLQKAALKLRKEKGFTVYSQSTQDVADRVTKSFKNFFRRVKENKEGKKQKVGYPRFKPFGRYKSITFPQYHEGFKILGDNLLSVSGVGILKIKYLKDITGKIKTLTIKKEPTGNWYAVIIAEGEFKNENHVCEGDKAVGIDIGITSLVATSDGELVQNPKILNKSEKLLKIRNRQLSKKQKRSKNRVKAKIRLAKVYKRIEKERETFLHEITNRLIKDYKFIILEKLNIMGIVRNHHLAKSILDASWNELIRQLSYKAEEAGSVVLLVDPRNTSKTCSRCGWIDENLTLEDRVFKCENCGLEMDRDVNAAKNIYKLGLEQLEKLGTLSRRGTMLNACGDEASTLEQSKASIVAEAGKLGSDLRFQDY